MKWKNVAIAALILFSLATLASAQSITLLKPNGGSFAQGANVPIAWQYTGIPHTATVRVVLFLNGVKLRNIATGVPITEPPIKPGWGALKNAWKAEDYPDCGFKIRVVVEGGTASDYSDSPFCITGSGETKLSLKSPLGGEIWEIGSSRKISWTCTGYAGQLLIKLKKNGVDWGAINPGVAASSGAIDWTVGDSPKYHEFVPGDDYQITIEPVTKLAGGPESCLSKPFSIAPKPGATIVGFINPVAQSPGWIKVAFPAANDCLTRVDQYQVRWECSENLKKKYASMSIFQNGQLVKVYAAKFPLSISRHDFQLPSDIPLGDYQLRIATLDSPRVTVDSGLFHVVKKVVDEFTYIDATVHNAVLNEKGKDASWSGCGLGWNAPGPLQALVGWRSKNGGVRSPGAYSCRWFFHSWLRFDLKELENSLEVLSAELTYDDKLHGVSEGPMRFYRFTQPWDGRKETIFTEAGIEPIDPLNLRQLISGWFSNPTSNYGLLVKGSRRDTFQEFSVGSIHILSNIKLKVRTKIQR